MKEVNNIYHGERLRFPAVRLLTYWAAAVLCLAGAVTAVEEPPKKPMQAADAAGAVVHSEKPKRPQMVRGGEKASEHRVLQRNLAGKPTIIQGNLGKLTTQGLRVNDENLKAEAKNTLQSLTIDILGATGLEILVPRDRVIVKDKQGKSHIRFEEEIHGMKVEGASMFMHLDKDENVFALNGEFVSEDSIPEEAELDCKAAMASALEQSGIEDGEWLTDCELSVVHGADGHGHLAWKRLISFHTETGLPQKDVLFGSATTGALVARHPKHWGARSLRTKNCGETTFNCPVVSTSSSMINTGDNSVDSAHNHAIKVYNYFAKRFGRDSLDGLGITVESNVRFDVDYSNAFWDDITRAFYYGDGDGKFPCKRTSQTLPTVLCLLNGSDSFFLLVNDRNPSHTTYRSTRYCSPRVHSWNHEL